MQLPDKMSQDEPQNVSKGLSNFLECEKYDLGGHQEILKVKSAEVTIDFMLFSEYCYGDILYLKMLKQIKVRQSDDEIHIYLAAAARIHDDKPSSHEKDHFSIFYNLMTRRVEFIELAEIQKVIEERELVSFEQKKVVDAFDNFLKAPILYNTGESTTIQQRVHGSPYMALDCEPA